METIKTIKAIKSLNLHGKKVWRLKGKLISLFPVVNSNESAKFHMRNQLPKDPSLEVVCLSTSLGLIDARSLTIKDCENLAAAFSRITYRLKQAEGTADQDDEVEVVKPRKNKAVNWVKERIETDYCGYYPKNLELHQLITRLLDRFKVEGDAAAYLTTMLSEYEEEFLSKKEIFKKDLFDYFRVSEYQVSERYFNTAWMIATANRVTDPSWKQMLTTAFIAFEYIVEEDMMKGLGVNTRRKSDND